MTRLILDDVDPKMLQLANANKRLHWRRKAEVTAYWRQLAFYAALAAATPTLATPVHVTVTIRWPDATKRDPGNWSVLSKPLIDGLTDARWWPDDNSDHVIGPDLRRDPVNGPHRVVVDVEEVGAS